MKLLERVGIPEQADEIVESDEHLILEAATLVQAEPDGRDQRVDHERGEHDEERRDEEIGRPALLA